MKFKVGDGVVRVTDEYEKNYCGGGAPSLEYIPVGTIATVMQLVDAALFDVGNPEYYVLYGDWALTEFTLENE